jgi:hypothetical protein
VTDNRPVKATLAASLVAIVGALVLPGAFARDSAHGGGTCIGETSAANVKPVRGAPPLRFGINPAGFAGAAGPPVAETPESRGKTLDALGRLRSPGKPFVLRLNRLFWSDRAAGIDRFVRLTHVYRRHGYPVEIQVRYHPTSQQEGHAGAWVRYVRHVTRRLGGIRGVTALQITNEVNFLAVAPDASDGAFEGAKKALIRGIEAAHRVARRHGFRSLRLGFNWAYRNDPMSEASFWGYLRDHGGPRFVSAVDWVGLDAYPGTVFPPVEPTAGDYADGMVNAMSVLRECFMPIADLGKSIPIRVEENGWPTGPDRSEARQVTALRRMVGAVSRFRGNYGVSDYRWFDLRDHNTSSPNFQHHYGLLRDDYTRKPAFRVYGRVVRRLEA